MKSILFSILILAVSVFAACQSGATEIQTSTQSSEILQTGFKEIAPAEAKKAMENKDAQFIDVRTKEEYAGGHAPNAVNFPLDTLASDLGKLDKSKPVYVICQSGRRSKEGAKILSEAGFKQVFSIEGGTSAWTAAGLPVE